MSKSTNQEKVALVTGASSGMGKEIAQQPLIFMRKWYGDRVFDEVVLSQVK